MDNLNLFSVCLRFAALTHVYSYQNLEWHRLGFHFVDVRMFLRVLNVSSVLLAFCKWCLRILICNSAFSKEFIGETKPF